MFYWFIFLFSSFVVIFQRWRYNYWSKFDVNGPFPVPFLGTSYLYLWKPIHVVESELVKQFGSIVGLYEGSQPVLMVSDPEMIKVIAQKEFQSFPQSFTFSNYKHSTENLFPELIWGSRWKCSRGQITQCFTVSKLRKFFPTFEKCTEILIDSLNEEVKVRDTIEMKTFWSKYYCDTIFQFCLTLDAHSYSSKDNIIFEKMIDLSRPFVSSYMMNMFLPEWFIKLFHLSVLDKSSLDYMEKLISHLIVMRSSRSTINSTDVLNRLLIQNDSSSTETTTDQQLTEIELIASVIDLLFNGFETSSSLLSWCCWRLALNPECQNRLAQEIDSIGTFNYDNISSAPYLDAVINESLRIDPPETRNERVCHSSYHHLETNIVIPKGAKVLMPIYSMHHDPVNFPDPETFNPDRFLPENRESIQPFTFIPFGTGYRACIGIKYALIVSKLALAKLIKSYRLIVTPSTTINVDYDWGSILLCAKEINVGIEKR
ncbi:cytochrome P450 3A28-like [Panonychus citri]|uniref:cytochrome P450 3A28-like n=1 Tax=Panonychus citri TaxID=50023 RepID=UPI002306F4E6|nr:cytochrome P450 3A28-like [Panonychus citri]